MTNLAIVLDDEQAITTVVANALHVEGFEVVCVHSIEEFKKEFGRHSFDLAFIDLALPDGNGLDAARWIKAVSDTGVIVLTGRGDEIDRVLGLELGADDYIVKPFAVRELRARAKAILRRVLAGRKVSSEAHAAKPDDVQVLHGMHISRGARSIHRESGEEIELTTLEFDVLCVLAKHPNNVLSREQIMDNVRGPGWAAYDRTIDGLISRLRSKLFPDGTGVSKIRTIRGVGYMLVSSKS